MSLRQRSYLIEAAAVRAKKGKFTIKVQDPNKRYVMGATGQTIGKPVSGYIVGNIGLDKRGWFWGITHIPTGVSAGIGTFEKLGPAKLYADMANRIIPNTTDMDKARNAAMRHYDELQKYSQYLDGGGREVYTVWKRGKAA